MSSARIPTTDPLTANDQGSPAGSASPRRPTRAPAGAGHDTHRLMRIASAVAQECAFIIVPTGGWTLRRAAGRAVLAFLALSGPTGLALVASLVVLKEREHIARGIRRGMSALHDRHARRSPASTAPPSRRRGTPRRPHAPGVEEPGTERPSPLGTPTEPARPDLPEPEPSAQAPAAASEPEPSEPAPLDTRAEPGPDPVAVLEVDTRVDPPDPAGDAHDRRWRLHQTITLTEPEFGTPPKVPGGRPARRDRRPVERALG